MMSERGVIKTVETIILNTDRSLTHVGLLGFCNFNIFQIGFRDEYGKN
jgi:hypothetical protein